jgi:hypothetical protein
MPQVLPLRDAYRFALQHGLQVEVDEIREREINPQIPSTRQRTVRKGYMVSLFQEKGLWQQFVQNHWPTGAMSWGEERTKHYLYWKSRNEDPEGDEPTEEEAADVVEQGFVYESDLRNYLKGNLHIIEPGLRPYKKDDKIDGEEFIIDNGRIDILAVDKNDSFVVIELKLSSGRNKAIGQLLYYMGWVDANLGKAPCRGIIIAREIPPDLRLAVQRAPGISLYSYKISMSLEKA